MANISPIRLRLFPPVLSNDTAIVMSLTTLAKDWHRSTRGNGGFWHGSFMLEGDLPFLQNFFYRYLGNDIQEKVGRWTTWAGMIYEIDLEAQGVKRRRSLDNMYNAVKTINDAGVAAWSTDTDSIARYGRREILIPTNGLEAATVVAQRDSVLKETAWPWARPIGFVDREVQRLRVTVCGYIFTANWRYVTATDDNTGNVNTWISNIVATDCEFLNEVSIDTNTLQIKRTLQMDERAWDVIGNLVALGDATPSPWQFQVGGGGTVYYRAIDIAPLYYLRQGGLYSRVGSRTQLNPWMVQPGVARDVAYPVRRGEPGNPWLQSAADIWIEEIEIGIDSELILKPGEMDSEAELLAAQAAQRRSEEE